MAAMAGRLKNIVTKPLLGNPPWIHATWVGFGHRVVIAERDQAIRDANQIAKAGIISLYPDASVAARLAAIAVAKRDGESATVVLQESIGWASTYSVLTSEIAAIAAALDYTQESLKPGPQEAPFTVLRLRVIILSDSQHALEAIQAGNNAKTGRALLRKISKSFYTLKEKGTEVEFRWVPRHTGVCRNVEADKAAREATGREGVPTAPAARRIREAAGVIRLIENDRKSDSALFNPKGLPG